MDVLTADWRRDDVGAVFARSLHETGFALVSNAVLERGLLAQFYAAWAGFFASFEKYDCHSDPGLPSGYLPYRTMDGRLVDLKESFYCTQSGECPARLREATDAVHRSLLDLAERLLDELIAHSDDCPGLRSRLVAAPRMSLLRIIHYPALADMPECQQRLASMSSDPVRLGDHQDLNLLTVLAPATMPGLDIMDRSGGWQRVTANAEAVVVNAGDALQRLSGGYYRSTRHRVRNTVAELAQPRYAVALFLV
jgi:isopenicillin N synthase-like dioxygenase